MKLFYEFFRWVAIVTGFPAYWIYYKRKTYYEDGAPKKPWKRGGALVISNHYDVRDFPLTTFLVLPRKLNVVSSEIPYKSKFLTFGMRFFGGIKADRITGDMSFIGKSAKVIESGQLVQIYPEGRNTPDGNIHPFKQSYIVIAHLANAPIIPVVTDGNYGFFKRAHVIVGKPIYLSEYITPTDGFPAKAERTKANDIIYAKMLELRQQLEELKNTKHRKKGAK